MLLLAGMNIPILFPVTGLIPIHVSLELISNHFIIGLISIHVLRINSHSFAVGWILIQVAIAFFPNHITIGLVIKGNSTLQPGGGGNGSLLSTIVYVVNDR